MLTGKVPLFIEFKKVKSNRLKFIIPLLAFFTSLFLDLFSAQSYFSHIGSLKIIGQINPGNFCHVAFPWQAFFYSGLPIIPAYMFIPVKTRLLELAQGNDNCHAYPPDIVSLAGIALTLFMTASAAKRIKTDKDLHAA